ncbi:DUF4062 domain-containing protein [Bradyrhizobium japonicum]|uniref:DUF4062 domain-containing protein n=1 Tax=Bradyrhizobium japonicum TaxID=375 RepID=UPI0027146AB8|nr:DUF4062 domain-containing protein [Bradyrhizobium japonicum]WLB58754.1 DUF4062 domain-containing protein [Bradyrhizobium japonicum]WLB59445.1 DUF4062 domain-containing protein [Bradyrhizobium japonicum]
MQAKKYQVFVSSTYSDLIDERREVIEAIIDLGHIPAGMEGFPAIDIEQFKYIKKVIDQCDYYVLIVAGRYGSMSSDGTSFTEMEYRYAVESGKVVIAFVLDPAVLASLPAKIVDTNEQIVAKLEKFKADVMTGRLVRLWTDRSSLSRAVMKSLIAAFDEFPGEGWVRASVQANEDVLAQINELRVKNEHLAAENELLKAQLVPQIDNIASLDTPYLIKYTYSDRPGSRVATSLTMTWREIFLAVAPQLSLPQSPHMLAVYLQTHLKESGRTRGRIPELNAIYTTQIRVQLVAYGLIKEFRGQTIGGGFGEWVQITPAGNRFMIEEMVIRADQTGQDSQNAQ